MLAFSIFEMTFPSNLPKIIIGTKPGLAAGKVLKTPSTVAALTALLKPPPFETHNPGGKGRQIIG